MRILAEIDRRQNVPHEGKIVRREAVRAIIPQGRDLFMIHSKVSGDYKFPGGGVEKGERPESALKRELAEETGAELLSIIQEFGKMVEYDYPIEPEYDAFCMTSSYYVCKISPVLGRQKLEEYEAALGFTPTWVSVDEAIRNNLALLDTANLRRQRWVKRETQVLEMIKNELTVFKQLYKAE